jgi:RHS repeat-associated protein
VICELNATGVWWRGYVYLGNQLLALQCGSAVSWVHQDPVTKSQRVTNINGVVTTMVDLDPWGGDTSRSSNQAFQPHRFTSYERDGNGGDEAMMRRYTGKWHRFVQPDPYDGSYDLTDPQSFNRYAYVQNDPVNFVDPSGLDPQDPSSPPPTTHIDPATGQPVSVPGINAGSVTIFGDSRSGPVIGNTLLGGDAHGQLLEVIVPRPRGGSQPPRMEGPRRPSEPTPEGIRMGKRIDCLESAKASYLKVTQQTREEHTALFTSPVSVGVTLISALGGLSALVTGIGIRAAVGSAYSIGREIGNAVGYRNAVDNCYRLWGRE